MKILYVHNEYGLPSGEEQAAEKIVQLLRNHGHLVRWFRRRSSDLGSSVYGKVKGLVTGIYNPASAAALAGVLDDFRPDIVQVQNIYPLISPSIFAVLRRRGTAVVMRCPNYRLFCPNGRHLVRGQVCEQCLRPGRELWCVLRRCEGSCSKSAGYALRNATARIAGSIRNGVDVFVVQSEFQKNKFVVNGIPPERIEILPGMVSNMNGDGDVPVGDLVTYAGRISAEKGIAEFLEAARLLPDTPFVVAGDERQMLNIRQEAPPNVTWLGFLQAAELRDLFIRSRLVVVPSKWYEGFPNVLVEAMALGKPIICSAIGALPEIVEDGVHGLLFAPGDAQSLSDKIRSLYGDPERCRRCGAAAREKARQEYSHAAYYRRLLHTFARAIELNERKTTACAGQATSAMPNRRLT